MKMKMNQGININKVYVDDNKEKFITIAKSGIPRLIAMIDGLPLYLEDPKRKNSKVLIKIIDCIQWYENELKSINNEKKKELYQYNIKSLKELLK